MNELWDYWKYCAPYSGDISFGRPLACWNQPFLTGIEKNKDRYLWLVEMNDALSTCVNLFTMFYHGFTWTLSNHYDVWYHSPCCVSSISQVRRNFACLLVALCLRKWQRDCTKTSDVVFEVWWLPRDKDLYHIVFTCLSPSIRL
jgi:hypothetical protein